MEHHLAKHEAIVPSNAIHVHEYEGIKIVLARLGSRGGGAGFCTNSQFLPASKVSSGICTLASAPSELVRRGPIVSGSKPMRANSPPIQIEMAA
jgi:hypothetical protein